MSPHFERALRFAERQQHGTDASKMHDWTLSQLHALALELQETHDIAISAAARKAQEWALEAGGGSGTGGEGYMNLARAIDQLRVDK